MDKKQNTIGIWTALTIHYVVFFPTITFDTIQGHHNLKFTFSQHFLDYLVE